MLISFHLFVCLLLFFLSLNRATSSANHRFVRIFFPFALIISEIFHFLKSSSIKEVNKLGETGSPYLTPVYRAFVRQ